MKKVKYYVPDVGASWEMAEVIRVDGHNMFYLSKNDRKWYSEEIYNKFFLSRDIRAKRVRKVTKEELALII